MKHNGPLVPTLSIAAGIAAGYFIGLPWWTGIILIVLGITLYLLILSRSGNPVDAFRIGKWHIVWVVLVFVGIGSTDESFNRPLSLEQSYDNNVPDKIPCEVTAVLSKTYGDRVDLKLLNTNGAKVRLRSSVTDLSPGDIVLISRDALIDISKDTTEVGRRIAPMLKANGFLYYGRVFHKQIEWIGKRNSVYYLFFNLREIIESKIENSHISKSTSAFLNAILMGDKSGLDEETRLTFARGGTAHMLALSGLHLSILAGFMLFILWPLKFYGRYKWVYGIAIILLWIYVVLTGMSYSSVRACIMLSLTFLAIILERKNFAGNALCSSCLIILLFDPLALFDAGFQLSVICVGALIIFATPLNPIGHRNHPVLYSICGVIIATMVATAGSWVLTSYYFGQIPLMFLPSNLLLLPILPIYLAVAVIFVLFLCCGLDIPILCSFLDNGYYFLLWATEWLSGGTEFVVEYKLPLPGVLTWIGILIAVAWLIHRKPKTL